MLTLSKEVDELLRREMASGAYANEDELLGQALRLLAERREAIAGIQRGLDDIAAGRTTPFEDFDRDFRARHGIGQRS